MIAHVAADTAPPMTLPDALVVVAICALCAFMLWCVTR